MLPLKIKFLGPEGQQIIKWYHESYWISVRFWFIDKRCYWTVDNERKEQNGGFLGLLAATLVASSLGNMLTGKVILRIDEREQ